MISMNMKTFINKSLATLKHYKSAVVLAILLTILNIFSPEVGREANTLTLSNFASMLSVLPPILILIGLLDVWIPKETMMRYMGEHAGVKGLIIAFLLGSFAAGPLYAVFPVAAILLKKRAKLSNVLFFLGVWSTAKLPMIMFEYTSFGGLFTVLHITTNLIIFLIGAVLMDKMLSPKDKENIYLTASELAK